jgi:hypothetical protein
LRNSTVQNRQIVRRKLVETPRSGDHIVEQNDVLQAHIEPLRQRREIQSPGQIVGVKLALHHRPGYAETRVA